MISKQAKIPQKTTLTPALISSRKEASSVLKERISQGKEIQNSIINSEANLKSVRTKQKKWHKYNITYLATCFDSKSISHRYSQENGWGIMKIYPTLAEQIAGFQEGIGYQITELESILERLPLFSEVANNTCEINSEDKNYSKSVFIVHGHNDLIKTQVARLLEKLGFDPIILHEQPNKTQTLIRKFEVNAKDVGFAVIIITADDIGASKESPENKKPRARQNVILELGYFCSALGRERICILYEDGVEIPSDNLGVTFTKIDPGTSWHYGL